MVMLFGIREFVLLLLLCLISLVLPPDMGTFPFLAGSGSSRTCPSLPHSQPCGRSRLVAQRHNHAVEPMQTAGAAALVKIESFGQRSAWLTFSLSKPSVAARAS
jgi:hypothetical protein